MAHVMRVSQCHSVCICQQMARDATLTHEMRGLAWLRTLHVVGTNGRWERDRPSTGDRAGGLVLRPSGCDTGRSLSEEWLQMPITIL